MDNFCPCYTYIKGKEIDEKYNSRVPHPQRQPSRNNDMYKLRTIMKHIFIPESFNANIDTLF